MTSSTDAALDFLPLAIPQIQFLRHWLGGFQIRCQHQLQRFFGGFQPAGGVEARRELKTDFVCAEHGRTLRHFLQRHEAGAPGGAQPFQTGGNKNPVFTGERNQIRNRAQRHQIQQRLQVKFRRAGQIDFATALDQSVGEFEGQAGGAKLGECG